MSDLINRLRMGTQEPLFGLRQEAADRIAKLETENDKLKRREFGVSESEALRSLDGYIEENTRLKAENERLRKTEGHYIGCPLRGKLAAGIAPMCTPCTCNEIANEKAEAANAPPDDELARLERELAEQHAQAVIKCFGVADGNWWDVSDLEDFDGLRDDETEDLKDALRYLELRALLERHPTDPNLVRIKESDDE